DAADFQNMILGAQFVAQDGSLTGAIPSLYRPELCRWWVKHHVTTFDPTDSAKWAEEWNKIPLADRRASLLRPSMEDHPQFTGSNPAWLNPTGAMPYDYGFNPLWDGTTAVDKNSDGINDHAWDVDNDGDGFADSIWVDLGLPVRATADGQLYKPLVAILCIDMDGKLNLNAHGSLAQVNADPTNPGADYYATPTLPTTGQQYITPLPATSLLRGQGYGPAEINLSTLFTTGGTVGLAVPYGRLLVGHGQWPGRYGTTELPGQEYVAPDQGIDGLAVERWYDYDYTNGFAGASHAYGTPPDLQGSIAVGLDFAGRPVWDTSFCGQVGHENPYELNPLRRAARGPVPRADSPFDPTELERLLRWYDRDTRQPSRLVELAGVAFVHRRHEITTDSIDVPVPGGGVDPRVVEANKLLPPKDRTDPRAASLVDVIQQRLNNPSLRAGYKDLAIDYDNKDFRVDAAVAESLFGPDLVAGRKLNLNRPLPSSDVVARQELARYLYCLAYLFTEPADDTAKRQLAQWAVNAVDFMDSDSIMTPFEYDANPFTSESKAGDPWHDFDGIAGNPWDVDNDLQTNEYDATSGAVNRGLVWGMERPSLLITETLAIHDRRTEDRDDAHSMDAAKQDNFSWPPVEGETAPTSRPWDKDFDQKKKPQGSLFVELYNALSDVDAEKAPAELYDAAGRGIALNGMPGGSPTWRMSVYFGTDGDKDPNDPTETSRPTSKARMIYFVAPGTATLPADSPEVAFFPSPTFVSRMSPVAPGRYAVVGPGEPTDTMTATTYLGFRTDDADRVGNANTRRIELKPAPVPSVHGQVSIYA
ncbi:MAG: hypothetical protein U1E05_23555, partial [Patescibacteria group bacterium]|nr:hypothetical protein [Patescibacteria group bacterium]